MLRICLSLLAASVAAGAVSYGFWLGGMEFQRGNPAAVCYVVSLIAAVYVFGMTMLGTSKR